MVVDDPVSLLFGAVPLFLDSVQRSTLLKGQQTLPVNNMQLH